MKWPPRTATVEWRQLEHRRQVVWTAASRGGEDHESKITGHWAIYTVCSTMFRLWLCLLPKSRLIVIHIYPVLQIQSPETHLQLCSRNPAVVSFSSLTSSQWITKITFNLLSPQHIPTSSISRHSLWTLQQTGWGNQLMKILPLPPLLQTQSLSCIPNSTTK